MAYVKDSIFIQAPPEKVHAFAVDPYRWCHWFVGLGEVKSVDGDGSPGTVVEHSYLMTGVHIPMTTRVVESSSGADGSFRWKGENEGPLAGWLSWDYKPKNDGTLVTLQIEYAMPEGVPDELANRLFIERTQERAAQLTLENLKHLTEG